MIFKINGAYLFYGWISVLACVFWEASDGFYLTVGLLFVALVYRYQVCKSVTIRWIDVGIVVVLVSELINFAFSTYPANTFLFLVKLLTIVLLYSIYAIVGNSDLNTRLETIIGGYGCVLSMGTFVFFLLFRFNALQEGFLNLGSLKHMYAPFGQLSNDWSAVLLVLLAFNSILLVKHHLHIKKKWWVWPGTVFHLFALLVSFSRGAYLSLAVFILLTALLLTIAKVYTPKQIVRQVGSLSIVILGLAMMVGKPTVETIKGNQTTSQQRSTAGRLSTWESAGHMMTTHPLTGIGSGNFALSYVAYKSKALDATYTTRVSNTGLQLAVEKGWVGITAYSLFFFLWLFALIRQWRSAASTLEQKISFSVILGALGALAVKEFTFSTFFEHGGLMLILFVMAVLSRQGSRKAWLVDLSERRIFALLLLLVVGLGSIGYYFQRDQKATQLHTQAMAALSNHDYTQGCDLLNQAIEWQPRQAIYHIHQAVAIERAYWHDSADLTLLQQVPIDCKHAIINIPLEKQSLIIDHYQKAIQLNPKDDRAHHNLGWYLWARGDRVNALHHLTVATRIESAEAIYWISLGMLQDDLGQIGLANQSYEKALVAAPDITSSVVWRSLAKGAPERMHNRVINAKSTLKKYSQGNPILTAKYARLLIGLSEYEEATGLLEVVNNELPTLNRSWFNLGMLYYHKGLASEAIACFKRAVLLDENDYLPILMLALGFEKSRDYHQAITYYHRALRMQIGTTSEYDHRTPKMYATFPSFQTLAPLPLWEGLKIEYFPNNLCVKLAHLYDLTGSKAMVDKFEKLSHKRLFSQQDIAL